MVKISFDIDEDGNKVFNETDHKNEELKEFAVHFKGLVYINAYDEDDAHGRFNQLDDLIDYVDECNTE